MKRRSILVGAVILVRIALAAPPTLTVSGDVATSLTLTSEDLSKMPRVSITLSEHGGAKAVYEGVPVREILKKAGAPTGSELRGKALASYVVATGHDGYKVVLAIAELDSDFTDSKTIVADKRDGQPISSEQGPLRLVVEADKRPARCVRMLEKLELVRLLK